MFRPLFVAPITKNVFVAPPFERLMPPIDGNITEEHDASANYLVSSLHSLFTHFNVKEDIYSLGKHSEYVAEKLENLSAAIDRRKVLFVVLIISLTVGYYFYSKLLIHLTPVFI